MMEFITSLFSLVLTGVSLYGYRNKKEIAYAFWAVSGLAFLIVSVALVLGLSALQLPVTPYLGSIYFAFMALGLIALRSGFWKYYFTFILQIGLHSISGLITVFLQMAYLVKKQANVVILLFTLGGFMIAIGGMALAAITAGKPIPPLGLMTQLLHPLLFVLHFCWLSGSML